MEIIRRARDVRLVLIYHRVAPRPSARYEIVPTVPYNVFREHLSALGDLGRVMPLDRLLEEPSNNGEPLRLALTFDDDYGTHARYVLPTLRELGLHGTFFLSGRALHGLGAYWFERLEALVAERGLAAVAALLDVHDASEDVHLALACEGDLRRQALVAQHAPQGEVSLTASAMRELTESGMTIGFHTLRHPVLPTLTDDGLRTALTEGRAELVAIAGRPVDWFSYPHGKADERTLSFAREAGYTAAWTTQPRLMRSTDDPYRYGRWDPLPMTTADMLIRLGRFLHAQEQRTEPRTRQRASPR